MTAHAPATGSTLRKIAAAIVLVPLAIIIIAFAVANRQDVTVSFDPFGSNTPAASVTQPLFVVIMVVLILGVVVGGIAAWLRQARWRRAARRLEREVGELRRQIETLKGGPSAPAHIPQGGGPAERLQLQPPLHQGR